MGNLDANIRVRVPHELEARLEQAAQERMIATSTLARQILAHRLGLSKYDPLAQQPERDPCLQP